MFSSGVNDTFKETNPFNSKSIVLHVVRSYFVSQKFCDRVTSQRPCAVPIQFLQAGSSLSAANEDRRHTVRQTPLRGLSGPLVA